MMRFGAAFAAMCAFALLAGAPPAAAQQRDACAELQAIAMGDDDSDRREVARQAYDMLSCSDAGAGAVLAGGGAAAATGPVDNTPMFGTWDGDWNGWIGVWTFREDGTFSHNYGKGVDEECRHGVYALRGSRLDMQYNTCNRSRVDGTLTGDTVSASVNTGEVFSMRRQ